MSDDPADLELPIDVMRRWAEVTLDRALEHLASLPAQPACGELERAESRALALREGPPEAPADYEDLLRAGSGRHRLSRPRSPSSTPDPPHRHLRWGRWGRGQGTRNKPGGDHTFDSPRYLMTSDNKAVRDVAANAPYDAIYIMSNSSRYGGGGIYNLYASFVSDNDYDEYVFVHEFGHSFAGLADEDYSSKVAYGEMHPKGIEPWEPNITAQTRLASIKWRRQIEQGTPVPTPEGDPRHADKVGLFEGAGYSAKGLYRPAVDCKMFDKGHRPFCPVCMQAVARAIERYTR